MVINGQRQRLLQRLFHNCMVFEQSKSNSELQLLIFDLMDKSHLSTRQLFLPTAIKFESTLCVCK